jgi:hypothetical protein
MESLSGLSPDERAALATTLAVTLYHSAPSEEEAILLAALFSSVSGLLALMTETPIPP